MANKTITKELATTKADVLSPRIACAWAKKLCLKTLQRLQSTAN